MKAIILSISLAICVAAPTTSQGVISTDDLPIDVLVDRYYHMFASAKPEGTYHGTKDILGETIDATVVIETDSAFDFHLKGVLALDCDNEAYSYANNVISLPNLDKSGDCVHDALAANKVTLEKITYDPTSNEITIVAKYSVLEIKILLKHVDSVPEQTYQFIVPISVLFPRYYNVFMQQSPKGKYSGTKIVLGQTVTTTLTVLNDTDFSFTVTGPVKITCDDEVYKYTSPNIVVSNIDKGGDCLHDALAAQHATLGSLTYDAPSDTIHASLKVMVITISLDLTHQAGDAVWA